MHGPSDHVFECGLFQSASGIEVRIHASGAVVRSELVHHIDAGRMLAAAWRAGALNSGFEDAR